MDKWEKVVTLHRLLSTRKYPAPLGEILDRLHCSRPTFHRMKEYFITTLHAPLEYDRTHKGYYYDVAPGSSFELPGLWFTAGELEALFCMEYMLEHMQSKALSHIMAPARKRLDQLLRVQGIESKAWYKRIKYLPLAFRTIDDAILTGVTEAVLKSRQLDIFYKSPTTLKPQWRTISAQTLLRYRDNWYVDAWCHTRNELRTFCVDRIEQIRPLKSASKKLPPEELETVFAGSYGIFSGEADKVAEIRFCDAAARIVSREQWHPRQQASMLENGDYILRIPYKEDTELIMDIMRWADLAEVINPPQLRKKIAEKLNATLKKYQ